MHNLEQEEVGLVRVIMISSVMMTDRGSWRQSGDCWSQECSVILRRTGAETVRLLQVPGRIQQGDTGGNFQKYQNTKNVSSISFHKRTG